MLVNIVLSGILIVQTLPLLTDTEQKELSRARQLVADCRQPDRPRPDWIAAGHCLGYLEGYIEGYETATLACPVPPGVNIEQIRQIFFRYMDRHPEHLHE